MPIYCVETEVCDISQDFIFVIHNFDQDKMVVIFVFVAIF